MKKITSTLIAIALSFTAFCALAQNNKEHATEYEKANHSMHTAMTFEPSMNPDYDFLRGMRAHHKGALDMAQIELKYGKSDKVKRLAKDIIKAQKKEIALMDRYMVEIEEENGIVRHPRAANSQYAPSAHSVQEDAKAAKHKH